MFKKLQELLEAGKITSELANELDSEISTSLTELRNENASWRTKYNDLNKNFESISQTKTELETKLSNFDDAISKAKEDGKSELVTQLEAQKQETQKLQESLSNIENENKSLRIDTSLNSALSKFDVIDSGILASVLKNNVVVDGENVTYKDGESSVPLEDGLRKFFEDKPHLLKAKGNGGSGAGGNGNSGGGNKSYLEMSDAEIAESVKANGVDTFAKSIKG